jgi:predicted permease
MILILRPIRVLTRYWKLAGIAIFSLSIAMALGIVCLSLTNTFFILPPAAPAPDRLVMIHSRLPGEDIGQFSYLDYKYYREKNTVFTDIAAIPNDITVQTNFDGKQETKAVGRAVSDNYFSVLGVRPFLGRFYSPGEDDAKGPIAVMTYACWERLGSDPNIVGKTVANYTIIGVTPKEFTGSFYGLNGDLLKPLSTAGSNSASFTKRDARQVFLLARLKPGITRSQAQAEMAVLGRQLGSAYPKEDKDLIPVVTRATMLNPGAVPYAELAASILMLVVLLVLIIACANVANLLLAVAVGRKQEAAIKVALGAPRGRLIREFLKETTAICAISAGIGYVIAEVVISRFAEVPFILPMIGSYSLRIDLRLDTTVIAFTVLLTTIAIVAAGLAPALYASSPNLAQILSSEITVGGTRKNLRRNILVIAQVAVCTLVLVGMGLCLRSLYNLRRVDPGFSARNLVFVMVLPNADNPSEAKMKQIRTAARDAVLGLPGVESVAFTRDLPLGLGYNDLQAQIPGSDKKVPVAQTVVDNEYFSTMRIRILAGRVFDSRDRENEPDVVVINRTMAETFWPGQDPLGRSVAAGDSPRSATVIGVVADGKYGSLDEAARPAMYYALSQHNEGNVSLVARTSGDSRRWVQPVTDAMRAAGAFVYFAPLTLDSLMNFSLLMERAAAACIGFLSGLALLLAILGLLGAISYAVSERKKELGIRVALGARSSELLQMILRQTLRVTGAGVTIGILLGAVATVLLRSQFYGIGSVEWTVLAAVGGTMVVLSLLVAALSAMPWIRIDPMEAVRHT